MEIPVLAEFTPRKGNYIANKYPEKKIVAVSHGDPITAVDLIANNLPINNETMHISNANYVSHGEVLYVTVDGENIKSERVFRPK